MKPPTISVRWARSTSRSVLDRGFRGFASRSVLIGGPVRTMPVVVNKELVAEGSGVYYLMYMTTRTQIYLTDEQRARLAERSRAKGVPMSQLIRDAVDSLLGTEDDLDATFGSAPDIAGRVPTRAEWDRRG